MNLQPRYSIAVARADVADFRNKKYDINFILLVHFSGKYRHRFTCMQRFGFLNSKGYSVHVLVVASPGDMGSINELKRGWPPGVDVSILIMNSNEVVPKSNGAYLWLRENYIDARWHIRVDDDSMTDIMETLRYLDNVFEDQAIHLLTSPIEPEADPPVFTEYASQNAILVTRTRFEWESSVTSDKAMRKILQNTTAVDFLRGSGQCIAFPCDRALTMAAYIADVPVGDNQAFTKDFAFSEFTLFRRGRFSHIHFVPWHDEMFLVGFDVYLNGRHQPITEEHVNNITGQAGVFGRGVHEELSQPKLFIGGAVGSHRDLNETRWRFVDGSLQFCHACGFPTTLFTSVVETPSEVYFFGKFLQNQWPHYLRYQK